ncbi:MAG: DNA-binding protein containing wHTH domain [Asgard archaea virus SkuldV2]|nr:MAG: DNA-binding protein containing wHTH domain [Asgard archaea virus SkuldV2]
MIKRDNLLKKVGFYKTLEILDEKGDGMTLRAFYEKLHESGSYNNAFHRVNDIMILKEIIEIYYGKVSPGVKKIKLTRKGMTIKQTLTALLELME